MSTRALIYCRISEDREGAGLGVDRQQADCHELAERLGWDVVEVHVDNDISAYSGKPRPGYQAMLAALERGDANGVLVWHTDRLHRSPVELEDYVGVCERNGVATHTVKAGPLDLATPSGRLVARQLGAVARYEVEHQVERLRAARLQSVTAGRWAGGRRPFGYEADGITPRPDEAALVAQATDEVIAGAPLNAVARTWNDQDVRTAAGCRWTGTAVRRLLTRARNAGLMIHNEQVVGKAEWPAIVDEDRWRAVCAVLGDPARRTNMGAPPRHLGSALYRCGVCDDGTTLHSSTDGTKRRAYCCPNGKHVLRDAASLDAYITAVVLERLSRPDAADVTAPERPDTTSLHVEAEGLRARLSELANMYADDAIDGRQLAEGTAKLRTKLTDVERRIGEAASGTTLVAFAGTDPAEVWARLDVDRRRAVIDALMTVTVHKARKGRPPGWQTGASYFDPESVAIEWKGGT